MANVSSPVIKNEITALQLEANVSKTLPSFVDCYSEWNLTSAGLSKEAFTDAVKGYNYLQSKQLLNNTGVLTIVDYSKPSSQKRLYVLDMNSGKVLFNTLVAHGRNSGLEYATNFSNKEESHQTSLGFFVTQNTYNGGNGYSLKLKGCEKGINDKATERAIVMHGAQYADERFLQNNGYLGRSYGCPAVPEKINKKIIDAIKNGSCMFLYHPTKRYTTVSKILNS
ncbi:MAG: murein L,D-transpeptidase catalytic domain family protein [Ferruginibacter sp.]|nr:murein L,D-transpeptidase catalytic domain family protein [Ferruginibacter sp.]